MKALIGPHAGFAYSGPNAAWAYKNIDPNDYDRVVLLGPSHQLGFEQLAVTGCDEWDTPLGKLVVDKEAVDFLCEFEGFITIQKRFEESEHSLELHTPYIAKIFAGKNIKFLPIMVG